MMVLVSACQAMDMDGGERVQLALLPGAGGVAAGARFMAGGRVADRAALLDGRITDFSAALERALGEPAGAPVHVASQVRFGSTSVFPGVDDLWQEPRCCDGHGKAMTLSGWGVRLNKCGVIVRAAGYPAI